MRPVPQVYWPATRAEPNAEQKAVRARHLRMGERIELATSLINREISVDQASRETGASREQVAEWVRRHGGDRIIQLSELRLSRTMPPTLLARCNQLVELERCLMQLQREILLFESVLKERLRHAPSERPSGRLSG